MRASMNQTAKIPTYYLMTLTWVHTSKMHIVHASDG